MLNRELLYTKELPLFRLYLLNKIRGKLTFVNLPPEFSDTSHKYHITNKQLYNPQLRLLPAHYYHYHHHHRHQETFPLFQEHPDH